MALPQSTVNAIQQAGQSVFRALQATQGNLESRSAELVTWMSTRPFDSAAQQAVEQFKRLSQLSHALQEVEAQLRGVYAAAVELASPEADVLLPPASLSLPAPSSGSVQDVQAKPKRASRRGPTRQKPGRRGNAPAAAATAARLTPNDAKVLDFLRKTLAQDAWSTLTGKAVAQGAGLAAGSVAVSLSRLVRAGVLLKGARSQYRLQSS